MRQRGNDQAMSSRRSQVVAAKLGRAVMRAIQATRFG
jgi:hypothetical protein